MANIIASLVVSIPLLFSGLVTNPWFVNPARLLCHYPTANPDFFSGTEGQVLDIPAPGVLENDSDPDDPERSAVLHELPAHGNLEFSEDGSFIYTPSAGFSGEDTFSYFVVNTWYQSLEPAVVTLTIEPTPKVYLPLIMR